VFSALDVCYEKLLYEFTFDTDTDIVLVLVVVAVVVVVVVVVVAAVICGDRCREERWAVSTS